MFRAVWLQEGDKNTKFFHSKVLARKRKNTIGGLLNENNKWRTEADEIERLFCAQFADLFTSTHPIDYQMEKTLEDMSKKVTENMNKQLYQTFTGGNSCSLEPNAYNKST